jgi:hypothetical protein
MQLASIALVVQSFRYGPRHLVLTGDADRSRPTTPFTVDRTNRSSEVD